MWKSDSWKNTPKKSWKATLWQLLVRSMLVTTVRHAIGILLFGYVKRLRQDSVLGTVYFSPLDLTVIPSVTWHTSCATSELSGLQKQREPIVVSTHTLEAADPYWVPKAKLMEALRPGVTKEDPGLFYGVSGTSRLRGPGPVSPRRAACGRWRFAWPSACVIRSPIHPPNQRFRN